MATIMLGMAGAAIGGGFGGTVLGLSGAVIGRAAGAMIGNTIDQRLLGQGARTVEVGRIDRLHLQSAGEGRTIPRVWGQVRLGGQVIWAAPPREVARTISAGRLAPKTKEYSYEITCAIALCEGPILGVGRIWADGEEVTAEALNLRLYLGDEAQIPDPAIAAVEGAAAPAYRGTAYVVIEALNLYRWGNRMPNLSFEVVRAAQQATGASEVVRAVAMIPGTGEYALATSPVRYDLGLGETVSANQHTAQGTDFSVSLDQMRRELPNVGSVSLVVSWFGDDLRAGMCQIRPKVEDQARDGQGMAWRAGGISRAEAAEVPRKDGRPIYGGTPADASVIEAIRAIRAGGQKVVFYPFILMDQLDGNARLDPWTGAENQPVMPWRGRITTQTPLGDGGAQTDAEVAAFFGTATAGDFTREGKEVRYHGPAEWSMRRFILHYAHLCAAAGGVDAFLIGSEMVGLTRVRGQAGYPAVAALRTLAAEVRQILPDAKISYAADWTEYFGDHRGAEVMFHLDPLWADANIDFVGIDNYMPLSDWRDGDAHLDAHWGSVTNPDYLYANIAGGEGFDWYYKNDAHRVAQIRTPIRDGAYGEDWIWRFKDIRGWWDHRHHNRPGGQREDQPTAWLPRMKPVWFTEIGCAAMDKATNQPNKFIDLFSSESSLPYGSGGGRDDGVQLAYLQAMARYWGDEANNPPGMVDLSRSHVWAWDGRPYPAFPARGDVWADGPVWARGHWLNGRASAQPLADVVREICSQSGVSHIDTSDLDGVVRGYALQSGESGRAALQPLMLAYGFDAVERDGRLVFRKRGGPVAAELGEDDLALLDKTARAERRRASPAEIAQCLRLSFVEAGGSYGTGMIELIPPDAPDPEPSERGAGNSAASGRRPGVTQSELPLVLDRAEARAIAQRWLAEAEVARDALSFGLGPSWAQKGLGAGDVVRLDGVCWRIDRMERAGALTLEAVRTEPSVYHTQLFPEDPPEPSPYRAPAPVWSVVLDLPFLGQDAPAYAPYIAATATPWSGPVVAWAAPQHGNAGAGLESPDTAGTGGFAPRALISDPAGMGRTESDLPRGRAGLWQRQTLCLRIKGATLASAHPQEVLAGANRLAIGDGSPDRWEIVQFAQARLVGPDTWEVSGLLRGQAGSDAEMPDLWPKGSVVVVLDQAVQPVEWRYEECGLRYHWRVGPASEPPEAAPYQGQDYVVRGVGLRPYRPCHLRFAQNRITWIRRTRVDGDGWDGPDVPLGEAEERYHLRFGAGEQVLYDTTTDRPTVEIPTDIWQEARAQGGVWAEVAQLSARYGAGPYLKEYLDE